MIPFRLTIAAGLAVMALAGPAFGAGDRIKPPAETWSFSGPFGRFDQAQLQLALVVLFAQRQKVKLVRVFEQLRGQVRLWRWQCLGKVGDGFAFALPQPAFDLMHQHTAAPAVRQGSMHVVQCFFVLFALGHDGQVVAPGDGQNLRNRLFRK